MNQLETTTSRIGARVLPARRNLLLTPTPNRAGVFFDVNWVLGGLAANVLTWERTSAGWSYPPAGSYAAHLYAQSLIKPQGQLSTTLAAPVTLLVTPFVDAYVNPPVTFSIQVTSTAGFPLVTGLGYGSFTISNADGSNLRTVKYTGISGNTFTGCSIATFVTAASYTAGAIVGSPGCHTGIGVTAYPTVPGREYAFIGRAHIDRLASCQWLPGPSGAPTGPASTVLAGAFPTLIYADASGFPAVTLGEDHDPPILAVGESTWVMRRTAPANCTLMIGSFGFGDGLWPNLNEYVEFQTAGWQFEDVTGMGDITPANVASLLPYGDGDTAGWKWDGTPGASTSTRKPGLLSAALPVA